MAKGVIKNLTCRYCKKEKDIKEVRRVYSESVADAGYCSAYCKTMDYRPTKLEGEHTFVNESTIKQIIEALILLEHNNHLSAHSSALTKRRINREKAVKILLEVVEMSEEELEEFFWKSQEV